MWLSFTTELISSEPPDLTLTHKHLNSQSMWWIKMCYLLKKQNKTGWNQIHEFVIMVSWYDITDFSIILLFSLHLKEFCVLNPTVLLNRSLIIQKFRISWTKKGGNFAHTHTNMHTVGTVTELEFNQTRRMSVEAESHTHQLHNSKQIYYIKVYDMETCCTQTQALTVLGSEHRSLV